MRLRAFVLAAALVLTGSPAYAVTGPVTVATDPCGDGSTPNADITRVALHYSAASFQVRLHHCAAPMYPRPFRVEVHLATLGARITGDMLEDGKFLRWTGLSVCVASTCRRIKDSGFTGDHVLGYGAWQFALPGVTIPDAIEWYAATTTTVVDRAPDVANATSHRMDVTRASFASIRPIPAKRWQQGGLRSLASGYLNYDSTVGPSVRDRLVTTRRLDGSRIEPQTESPLPNVPGAAGGAWGTEFGYARNTTVVASFDGDGFTDPSTRPSTKALVSALVSLDLPATKTVRRGGTVIFRGVVRPKAPGTNVTLQVRTGPVGSPWRNFHTEATAEGADTYYYMDWHPTVRGTATFRVVWTAGTQADGGVTNGISNYTTITVT